MTEIAIEKEQKALCSEENFPLVQVSYLLTEREILKELQKQNGNRRTVRNIIETVLLAIVGGIYASALLEPSAEISFLTVAMPILCIVLIAALWWMPVYMKKDAVKRTITQGEITLRFFEDKIIVFGSVYGSDGSWRIFLNQKTEYTEREEAFVISLPAQQMLLIPFRVFSAEELQTVRRLFSVNVGE